MKIKRPTFRHFQAKALQRAFTILEVVLAVTIAVGLLLVLLTFYSQASQVRQDVMTEAGRISVIRLVMDRLTSELRSIPSSDQIDAPLWGGEATIGFISATAPAPQRTAWNGSELGRLERPEFDLHQITYAVGDGLLDLGIFRTESAWVEKPIAASATPEADTETESQSSSIKPLAVDVEYLHFRYWDGTEWLPAWNQSSPPRAVEITLGVEPLPVDMLPEDYPYEVFRRVVALPSGMEAPSMSTEATFARTANPEVLP